MRSLSSEVSDYLNLFAECKKETGASPKDAERATRLQLALPAWTLENMGAELARYKQRIVDGFVEGGTTYEIARTIMENVCVFDERRESRGVNPCDVMANSVRWNRMNEKIEGVREAQSHLGYAALVGPPQPSLPNYI